MPYILLHCKGEHSHPPPPPSKIPFETKTELQALIEQGYNGGMTISMTL